MVSNNKTSKLAVGALLACQIGTFSTKTHAGIFDAAINTAKDFAETPLRIYRTNPATLVPFLPKIMDLVHSIPSFLKKIYKFGVDHLESEGDFSNEESLKEEVGNLFRKTGLSSFKSAYKELMLALKNIARSKEIRESGADEAEETNFILVSGISTPVRKKLLNEICDSTYSKDVLSIDLTKYEGKSTSSIVDALFSSKVSRPSWMRSYSDDDDEDTLNSQNTVSEYIKKNKNGVVKVTVTPKVLKSLDPVFSALTQPNAKGKTNFGGKEIYTGNLTFIIEVKENNVGKKLEFLGRSHRVSFPEKLERGEIESLVYDTFCDTFDYYAEMFGLSGSFDRLLESICDVLEKNPKNATVQKMSSLCKDFSNFLDKNEKKLRKQKSCDIIYDVSKGDFAIVSKAKNEVGSGQQ